MRTHTDIRIKQPVPFLRGRKVLFLGNGDALPRSSIEDSLVDLRRELRQVKYKFLYLPELVDGLSPELLRYMFPGLGERVFAEDLYRQIRSRIGLGDEAGFLYRQGGGTWFHALPLWMGVDPRGAVSEFLSELVERQEELDRAAARKTAARKEYRQCQAPQEPEDAIHFSFDTLEAPAAAPEPRARAQVREEVLDPQVQALLDYWKKFSGRQNVTLDGLRDLLDYKAPLSHLTITPANRIFLSDLEGRPEIVLDDLTKALYFFYLRHPEGVVFKELQFYEEEIYRIYLSVTNRDNLVALRSSAASLAHPYSTTRDACASRIRGAFRNIFEDHIARNYYISGTQGGVMGIPLDRDLVIWERR